jgi:hypothetical protein
VRVVVVVVVVVLVLMAVDLLALSVLVVVERAVWTQLKYLCDRNCQN